MSPATDWREIVPDGEAQHLEELAEILHKLQKETAHGAAPDRALHAKGQGGVLAELTVLPDLPEYARVGIFATPATHKAYVRYSNGVGQRNPDRKPDIRGLAIKILGVPGKKIIPGLEDATTQDFLLIHTQSGPFKNADEFMYLVQSARSPALLPFKLIGHFGLREGLRIIKHAIKMTSLPMVSVATTSYYTTVPFKFGAYAARAALIPHARNAEGAKPAKKAADYLNAELAERLAREPIVYDFQVQFFVDEQKTPIEDGSVNWEASDAPYVTLARLTIGKQDLASPRGKKVAEYVEKMSFDPWHTTADFRPLGNIMRARGAAYRLSVIERKAAPEPDGSETFD